MSTDRLHAKNILVLGAYGFIGAAVSRHLVAQGATVTALVRNRQTGEKVLPGQRLVQGDLRDFLQPPDWQGVLQSIDCVVNCAGALQDSRADDLEVVHHRAIAALARACAQNDTPVVQISATDARLDADTEFMRSKARGDAALRESGSPVWILKPGLVIGQSDYGGTALLRMLAAVPVVQPIAFANAPVQCVGMPDLCRAVALAVAAEIPQGSYDLVEDAPQPLSEVLAATRQWLGFRPARVNVPMPQFLTRMFGSVADLLGNLGWRSPLRRTAITVMAQGVTGDPSRYQAASGHKLANLDQIYAALPCGREHRLTARMTLLMPLVVAVLCLFWVLSGVLGLFGLSRATEVLTLAGWSTSAATLSVVFWSLVDIALGLAILWRPWAMRACLAQAGVALFYLIAATVTSPDLWADPLGPLVKILPALMLSLVARPMLESR